MSEHKSPRSHTRDSEKETPTEDLELEFYRTLQSYEHHFNDKEFEVRKLASEWLLVVFAGLAFVFRGEIDASKSLLGAPQLVVLICLLGNVGMLVFWTLDQVVYHGLLDAAFTSALRIESRRRELPPLRCLMIVIAAGVGMARFLSLFYIVPTSVLAVISATTSIWASTAEGDARFGTVSLGWASLALCTALVPVALTYGMRKLDQKKTLRAAEMSNEFGALYRNDQEGFKAIVNAWGR